MPERGTRISADQEMKAPPPKDTKCKFCGRRFTQRGVLEHQRHHCPGNPDRRKREFKMTRCKHCGKKLHGNGLRVHVASVHPEAYARSRSVKAHRMKETRARSVSAPHRHAHVSPKRAGTIQLGNERVLQHNAPTDRDEHDHRHHQRRPETREETTQRIWRDVLSRVS